MCVYAASCAGLEPFGATPTDMSSIAVCARGRSVTVEKISISLKWFRSRHYYGECLAAAPLRLL